MDYQSNPPANKSQDSSKSGSKNARSSSYTLHSKNSQYKTFDTLNAMDVRLNKFTANPYWTTLQSQGKTEIGGNLDEMSPVVSEPPVEYDGFEQLANKYIIKDQPKKVSRDRDIKPRSTTPKKEPGTIKQEPGAPLKQKPDTKEGGSESPHEDPFATKPEYESDTETSDSENKEEDPDTWTVIVYKGVVNKGKPAVENRRFVMFSESPRMYIRVEELEARLVGNYQARYDNDWKLEHQGQKPFTVWKMNGIHNRIAIPSLTFKKSVAEQYAYWNKVAKTASRTKANYDPASRYWDLPGPYPIQRHDIELRFEASDTISQKELEGLVPIALEKCWCQPRWKAVEFGEGILPGENEKDPWILVDKHLLGLYSMYASPKTIKILKNQYLRLWMDDRNFPDGAQAAKADNLLFPKADPNTPPTLAPEMQASVSPFKLDTAVGQRAMAPTQAAVMNNKSATLLAQIFGWPANVSDNKWINQAEWLHRCAFSYGGLGESANYLTSQTPDNLIFGTKEANTLMMRAEATIKHLVWLEDQDIRTWHPKARTDNTTASINTKFGYNHHEEGDKPYQQDYVDENFKLNLTERSSAIIKSALKKNLKYAREGGISKPGNATGNKGAMEKKVVPSQADGISEPGNVTGNKGAIEEEVVTTGNRGNKGAMEVEVVPTQADGVSKPGSATENEGAKKEGEDTAWMKEKQYRWFAPRLVYEVSVSLGGRSHNTTLEIIPFARRIPMRLEFELDKLVEERAFGTKDPKKNPFPGLPPRSSSKARKHGSHGAAGEVQRSEKVNPL